MSKKVLVLTLGLLLLLTLGAFGGRKPPSPGRAYPQDDFYKIIPPANEDIISQYLTTPAPELFVPFTKDTAGYTYWDAQHDNSMRRQIANDFTGIKHFTWMDLVGPYISNNRYVSYNALYPNGNWLALGGFFHVTSAVSRGGYTGLDILPDSREVIYYHCTEPTIPQGIYWGTTISIERTTPGLGQFNQFDIPDSVKGKDVKGMWPTVACSKAMNGDTAYIHITQTQFIPGTQEPSTAGSDTPSEYVDMMRDPTGDPKGLRYVRCFEKPTNQDTLVCQSPGWRTSLLIPKDTKLVPNKVPYKFATARLGGTAIATSPVSQKVAVVWLQNTTSGSTLTKNELMYLESTKNGNDWIADSSMEFTVKVTNYANEGYADRAYPDIAAVYDYSDSLHLVWTTFKSTNQNDVTLWHWSASTGIRKVGSVTASSAVNPGVWNLLIAKMTMGVEYMPSDSSAYNYLYVVYTKFNDSDISASGFANGDLYLKASSNGGLSWGADTNLTNTNSNGCIAGNCKSEHWSSVAERVDSFLYVQYIYDLDAGGAVYGEGTFTKNPVRYLKYPRPLVPAVPGLYFAPSQLTSPTEWATNHSSKTDSIMVDNIGTATLQVQLSGPSWLTIAPSSFSIAELGPTQKVTLTLNGGPYADTFLTGKLKILSNSGVVGGGLNFNDTQYVDINFVVTDTFYYAEYDTVNTGTGGIYTTVSNVGNIGNEEDGNQMNYKGHDYLFDCSPLLVTPQASASPDDTVAASWLHDRVDFYPESHLQIVQQPEFATWGITIATSKFAPLVTRLSNPYQWFWWWWTIEQKDVFFENERVIVKYTKLYKNPPPPWWWAISQPSPQPSVIIGIGGDWDVTSDASGRNKGAYNSSTNLIYVYSDSSGFTNNYGGFYFYYGAVDDGATHDTSFAPWVARVQRNKTQMYPTRGYDDDSLFKYMSITGWSVEQDSSQDMNIIISAINPAKLSGRSDTALITAKYALVVSDAGLTGLLKPMCGNANRDDKVTVSDVVFLVNYLFKGGPKPFMYYSNANGDNRITVADVVYLVNYLFKGGPKPICGYPIPLPGPF